MKKESKLVFLVFALVLFSFGIISAQNTISGYVFDSDKNTLANVPVEIEDEAEAAEHLFSVPENTLSTSSSTKLYLREDDLLSKEAPTISGYCSHDIRYGASVEWSYILNGDIDGSYYKVYILLYAYQTTCDLEIIHKKQSGGETVLASWTGVSTSDSYYYQWESHDTYSGVNPDASSGDKIIFRITSANSDKWVSVLFCGVNVKSYIMIPLPAVPRTCGCVGKTKIFICEENVTESCTLNCSLTSIGTCFGIGENDIIINGDGFNITGSDAGNGIYVDRKNNVTIKNFNIYNFSKGIHLKNSSNSRITNNILNNNKAWGGGHGVGLKLENSNNNNIIKNIANSNEAEGIELYNSSNNTIKNNIAYSNYGGIWLDSSTNNILINNNLTNNNGNSLFVSEECNNQIDTSNIGGYDEKPILYKHDTKGITIANTDVYSEIILCNVSNSMIDNITIHNGDLRSDGLFLIYSNNNTIKNNNLSNNDCGICLDFSLNNIVHKNNISNNYYGIAAMVSSNNIISENKIYFNNVSEFGLGIFLYEASNNTISKNNIFNNNIGLGLFYNTPNNTIINNNFFNNANYDLYNNGISINITAEYNWWGTTNCTEIDNKIYDEEGLGKVDFEPLLDALYPEGKPVFCILLPGDVDGNCKVDIFDLAKVGLCYGCSSAQACWTNCKQADVREDNKIDIFDLATVGLNYGKTC